MSAQTAERARRVMDAVGRRDLEFLTRETHPDVEWQSFFRLRGEVGYLGHEGLRQWAADLDDAFEVARPEIDDVIAVGETVVVVGRLRYRGKESGVETATPTGWLLCFRDGRVTRFRAFSEPEQALRRIG